MSNLDGTVWTLRSYTTPLVRYKVLGTEHSWHNDQPMIRFCREDNPKKVWTLFTWDFFAVFERIDEGPNKTFAVKIAGTWHICRKEHKLWHDIEHGFDLCEVGKEETMLGVTWP